MRHASLLLLGLTLAAAAHGAEKIRYEDIPAGIAPLGTTVKGFRIKVTTADGVVHKGRSVWFKAAELELDDGDCSEDSLRKCVTETIPGAQVTRIEIRRGRRAFDFTVDALIAGALGAGFCFSGSLEECPAAPFGAAVAAASAPVTLMIDGIELLIPPRVYEIVH